MPVAGGSKYAVEFIFASIERIQLGQGFVEYSARSLLRLEGLIACALRLGYPACQLIGPFTGGKESCCEHGLAGFEDTADFLLQAARLLHFYPRAPAGIQIRSHPLQGISEATLLPEQERA